MGKLVTIIVDIASRHSLPSQPGPRASKGCCIGNFLSGKPGSPLLAGSLRLRK